MKTKTSMLVLFCCVALNLPRASEGATAAGVTLPVGTHIAVKTLDSVAETDSPGKRFAAQVAGDLTVKGRVVLPAGTKVTCKVVTSRALMASSKGLTVDLTHVDVGGHAVALKTTGAVPMDSYTTSRGVALSRSGYHVASGRVLQFQLAQPLKL
jgi:hypothetical protein